MIRITFDGPQALADPVARAIRVWYRDRQEPDGRLLASAFVLGDPWRALNSAAVPFWTYFPVQPALRALDQHLAHEAAYRAVDILLSQQGVRSAGIAEAGEGEQLVRRHGAQPRLVGVDPARSPHDIGTLGRYGARLAALPAARRPWSPMGVDRALDALRGGGLAVDAMEASRP